MRFKTAAEKNFYEALHRTTPSLYCLIRTLDQEAQRRFGREVCVTSVWRLACDPNKLHQNNRAVDLRVANVLRDGSRMDELMLAQWKSLAEWANSIFRYGRTLSNPLRKTDCVLIREKHDGTGQLRLDTHVHVQVKSPTWKS